MTKAERTSLLMLLGLGVVGHGIRLLSLTPEDAPGGITIASQLVPADLAVHRARVARSMRPLAVGERIDLNSASAEEIGRLPKVGPATAKALVRARREEGLFGSLADIEALPGIGPSLIGAIREHVTLSDTARARSTRDSRSGARGKAYSGAGNPRLPPVVVIDQPRSTSSEKGGLTKAPIDLNRASETELVGLPGIGQTRARAILAYRQTNGPFASVQDLEKVPGLPRRLVRQLATQVVIR